MCYNEKNVEFSVGGEFMDSLWSMSTTVREANRIYGFLSVAKKIEGEVWNKETQGKFQILLV